MLVVAIDDATHGAGPLRQFVAWRSGRGHLDAITVDDTDGKGIDVCPDSTDDAIDGNGIQIVHRAHQRTGDQCREAVYALLQGRLELDLAVTDGGPGIETENQPDGSHDSDEQTITEAPVLAGRGCLRRVHAASQPCAYRGR